jgi:dienelactone hydrolase
MPGIDRWDVEIDAGAVKLDGTLTIPRRRNGIIVFANGLGSRRDGVIARVLNDRGLGTLLLDLRSREGASPGDQVTEIAFDVPTMAERVISAIDWVTRQSVSMGMRIGLFGSHSGAAAAMIAAASRPHEVRAVVTRSGRPDLAGEALSRVLAPTLFIVAGQDSWILELNQRAGARMKAPHELQIVPGATYLFDEPGKLEVVGALAADWFWTYVRPEQPLERYMDPHIWA